MATESGITEEGLQKIREIVQGEISHGTYVMNEVLKTVPIYKNELKGSTLAVYLYLEGEDSGQSKDFKLIMKTGETLMIKPDVIQKVSYKGLLVQFSMKLLEVL